METIIGNQFPKKVIPLIEAAKNSIDIIVFDWRWYPQDPGAAVQLMNQTIIRARRRGVRVRAIANSDDIIRILKAENCQAKKLITKSLVHCKLMILDGQKVITGSHNYTQSAFLTNLELSVVLDDALSVAEFSSFFKNLWDSNA